MLQPATLARLEELMDIDMKGRAQVNRQTTFLANKFLDKYGAEFRFHNARYTKLTEEMTRDRMQGANNNKDCFSNHGQTPADPQQRSVTRDSGSHTQFLFFETYIHIDMYMCTCSLSNSKLIRVFVYGLWIMERHPLVWNRSFPLKFYLHFGPKMGINGPSQPWHPLFFWFILFDNFDGEMNKKLLAATIIVVVLFWLFFFCKLPPFFVV